MSSNAPSETASESQNLAYSALIHAAALEDPGEAFEAAALREHDARQKSRKLGALAALRALLETVRKCAGVSSYELFKATQGKMTLGNFLAFVAILKNGGLILESGGMLHCQEAGTKPA